MKKGGKGHWTLVWCFHTHTYETHLILHADHTAPAAKCVAAIGDAPHSRVRSSRNAEAGDVAAPAHIYILRLYFSHPVPATEDRTATDETRESETETREPTATGDTPVISVDSARGGVGATL